VGVFESKLLRAVIINENTYTLLHNEVHYMWSLPGIVKFDEIVEKIQIQILLQKIK
jgi:hypothetical protein